MADAMLPILGRRAEIEAVIRAHQVVVICGETGSGKTTQLPQMCLAIDEARGVGRVLIGHTQPRRIAARSVAARIAEERGEALGGSVGFKVRFADQTSRETRIKLMTDGLLLAELSGDPRLEAYSTIILDEAHERSLNVDFLLGYLRGLLPRRPELKLIITSATIEPKRFSEYFGGAKLAPVIEVSGRTYPIAMRYRAGSATSGGGRDSEGANPEAIADAVEELDAAIHDGDTLVFLPGEREIRLAQDAILRRRLGVEILPLFSRLSNAEQDRIFHRDPRARRVILATNVAETSLTVPGIRGVVDTGLAKISRYDAASKTLRLQVEAISQASANQRAGRCGRVAEGVCIRLFSEQSYKSRGVYTDPEIRRTSLAGVILQMRSLGLGAIEDFAFLDRPDEAAIRDGYETLYELGAVSSADRKGDMTPIGRAMVRMPLEPRIARMLLGGKREDVLDDVIVLAAALSVQDPRERPSGRQEEAEQAQSVFRDAGSDFVTLLNLWHASRDVGEDGQSWSSWCREHFLSIPRMREWRDMVHQLREVAEELPREAFAAASAPGVDGARRSSRNGLSGADRVHRALLAGLISNVACRESDNSFEYRSVRGLSAVMFPGSALFQRKPKWIMSAEMVRTSRLFARTIAAIDPAWIEECAGHMFKRQFADAHLDEASGRPQAFERVVMGSIVVVPRRVAALAPLDASAARKILMLEGLAQCRWELDAPFMRHNRAIRERARVVEARLRRRDVLVSDEALAAWFAERVPAHVCEPAAFEGWLLGAMELDERVLQWRLEDVLTKAASAAMDDAAFPSEIDVGGAACAVTYAFSPGKDDDGVTVAVPLLSLERVQDRVAWLVPGMIADVVLALLKQLPKARRSGVERRASAAHVAGGLEGAAKALAEAMDFGKGRLADALGEGASVLFGVEVPEKEWAFAALPEHLRMRVRVVGSPQDNDEIASGRSVGDLLKRLEARIAKAASAAATAAVERRGMTAWECGDLGDANSSTTALVDQGESVMLTLASTPAIAAAQTRLGVRRLFALAIADEVTYYFDALAGWNEMVRQFTALGSEADLRDQLTCMIAERVFMEGQSPVRSSDVFDARLDAGRIKLLTAAREVGGLVASMLEPRSIVAKRLSGGTNRLWAASIADIREHAAYLMPRGFLALAPADKLRQFPRYAVLMRERLLSLREDGSKAETDALAKFAPHWKRFTGHVAQAMSEERKAAEAAGESSEPAPAKPDPSRTKAPLPQARRAAPKVNLDAGEWAMQPGNLSPSIEQYRWALEELRVAMFSTTPVKAAMNVADVEKLWRAAQ
jgi:ATP-dependent helicase HrpA